MLKNIFYSSENNQLGQTASLIGNTRGVSLILINTQNTYGESYIEDFTDTVIEIFFDSLGRSVKFYGKYEILLISFIVYTISTSPSIGRTIGFIKINSIPPNSFNLHETYVRLFEISIISESFC